MTLVSDESRWSIALRPLADHELNFFFEADPGDGGLTFANGPATVFRDLTVARPADDGGEGVVVAPSLLETGLAARYGTEPLFTPSSDVRLGADFYPHVQGLVCARRQDLVRAFTLTDRARRFFAKADLYAEDTPADARPPHRLELHLSKAAGRRLSQYGIQPRAYGLEILDLTVFLFATGRGLAQLRLAVAPTDGRAICPLELLEAQIALGRFNRLSWVPEGATEPPAPHLTLSNLVRAAVLGPQRRRRSTSRVTSYTYMCLDDVAPPEAVERLALYSARHYTTDYALVPSPDGARCVRHFDTVTHAVALEGACTIVAPAREGTVLPEFLSTFKTAAFRMHYVPSMLLALHEHCFMADQTGRALSVSTRSHDDPVTLATLRRLRKDSLTFRLCFSFSQVSFITMHNAVYSAFREVLGLERMLEHQHSKVAEIEGYLRAEHQERAEEERHARDRRYHIWSVLGAAALAGLTTFTIVKEGGEVFEWHEAGRFGLGFALVVFLAAGLLGYLKRPMPTREADEEHDELAHHAAIEHMMHAARE